MAIVEVDPTLPLDQVGTGSSFASPQQQSVAQPTGQLVEVDPTLPLDPPPSEAPQQREPGFFRDEGGQLKFQTARVADIAPPGFKTIGKVFDVVGQALVSGGREAAVGLGTLAADILDPTVDSALGNLARSAAKNIPAIEREGAGDEIASALVQFGIPATGAIKVADSALKTKKVLQGTKFIERLGRGTIFATAGALSDFAVTNPEDAATLGDFLGGPTRINKEDTARVKRAKVATEALALSPIAAPFVYAFKALRLRMKPQKAWAVAREHIKDIFGTRADVILKEIEGVSPKMLDGVRPTAGTVTTSQAVKQTERGLRVGPKAAEFAERDAANQIVIARKITQSFANQPGEAAAARRFFETQEIENVEAAIETARRAEIRLSEAEAEATAIARELESISRGGLAKTDASVQLHGVVQDTFERTRATKNEKFAAIDPNRNIPVAKTLLNNAFEKLTTRASPGDTTVEQAIQSKQGAQLVAAIRRIQKEPENRIIAFQTIEDLRPAIAAAIGAAKKDGNSGGGIIRLLEFKKVLDDYAKSLVGGVDAAAGARAQEAVDFTRDIYAPLFKQGTGGEFAEAARKGAVARPREPQGVEEGVAATDVGFRPSETGQRFLGAGRGQAERTEDLAAILAQSTSPEQGRQASRNFLLSNFAENLVDPSGKINIKAARLFLRNNTAALRAHPRVEAEAKAFLNKAGRNEADVSQFATDVKQINARIEADQKAYEKSVAGVFINEDPVRAINKVMTGSLPDEAMADLVKQARGDRVALQGLRVAMGEWIDQTVKGGTRTVGAEDFLVNTQKIGKLVSNENTRKAIGQLYNPAEIKVLERGWKQLETLDQLGAGPSGRLTPSEKGERRTQLAKVLVDIKFGLFRSSRYVAAFKNAVPGQRVEESVELAMEYLSDAFLDPKKMRFLLETTPENANLVKKSLVADISDFVSQRRARTAANVAAELVNNDERQQ